MFRRDYFICDMCMIFYDSDEMCNIDDYEASDCDNESENNSDYDSDYSNSSNSKCFYKDYECNSTICEYCYDKYKHSPKRLDTDFLPASRHFRNQNPIEE